MGPFKESVFYRENEGRRQGLIMWDQVDRNPPKRRQQKSLPK